MKKAFLLVFIITIQVSCMAQQSKNELTFKVQIRPDTKYSETVVRTTEDTISFSGPQQILQNLKARGLSNPTIKDVQSKSESVLKTGKLNNGKTFPITMEIVKTTRSDGKEFIPDGTKIYGQCTLGGMPNFDSIASGGINENIKQQIINLVQKTADQLHSLPEKTLKVGESFSRTIPLTIPVASVIIKMEMKTTYKLLSIRNGIGNFGITITYTITTTGTKYAINASGSGKGKLLYDISEDYYRQYQINNNLEMTLDINNFKMDNKIKNSVTKTTSISKN